MKLVESVCTKLERKIPHRRGQPPQKMQIIIIGQNIEWIFSSSGMMLHADFKWKWNNKTSMSKDYVHLSLNHAYFKV